MNHLEQRGAVSDQKLYFYYREVRDGAGRFYRLSHKSLDWEKDVLANDAIVLESNLAAVGSVGYSFVADAIRYLRGQGAAPVKKAVRAAQAKVREERTPRQRQERKRRARAEQ